MAMISDRQEEATQKIEASAQIFHEVANGGPDETVETESGPTPTLKKWLKDHDAQVAGLLAPVTEQADRAEEAAKAAVAAGRVYDTIEDGLLATENDQYFSVPSTEDTESFILYQNVGGVADEATRYPSHIKVAVLEQQVAELLYAPPAIDSLLIDGATSKTVEVGSSVASLNLSWILSGSEPESQVIDNGVGSVPVGTTSVVANGPFSSSLTLTLTVADTSPAGNPKSDSAQVSLNFRQKHYWGVVDALSLDSAGILALASEFAAGRQKTITYNASAGGYPYYCYPAAWGAPSSVKVGGLSFSDYTVTPQPFANGSEHTENYFVIRFNTRQTGSSIEVQFA